ncbi:amino acid adenylation domain-containing protein [Plectonema radiosum NIES-515]|uniref:Amino acid adenylation domain-containing protein n=1 Tax=Plectonema radiosum NIES-515 TaxID=2986073 RepID=A0ABT3B5L0_9CYAN|nr:non-ribosomal peptide synthetase [Plectonema radiosum]MCV3216659.1 amino acid adenylation domain-containing protein [Plectonema radiosum NIES-515]
MKLISEFLSELSNLDIRLWLDGVNGVPPQEARLRCNAPKEILTAELQAEIAVRKAEIIQFLNTSSTQETIKAVPRNQHLPLSFGQQGLWFIDQLAGGSTAYNQLFAIKLQGVVEVPILEQALTEIIRRHEILRTTFKTSNGQAFQAIAPKPNFTLAVETLQWQELQPFGVAQSQRPFNLAEGSLLRVTLAKLAPEEYVLLFVIHHAIADAWSSKIFIQELAAIYEAFAFGKPSPLPELPIQYADFADWQHHKLQQLLPEQLRYWEQKLSDTPPVLQLPSRPRLAVQSFRGDIITLELNQDLTTKLKQLSQQSGVTLFMTLLAAFNTLLYRYTNQDDICVGTTIANRHSRELESLIGYFLNTLVMRTDLSGNPTFRELLQRVQNVAWEAYNHQDLPFGQLVAKLQPTRDLSHTPLFQVMFVLENAPKQEVQLSGLTLSFLEIPLVTAKFDLSVSMRETEQGLLAKFEYNTDLFDADAITRMAGHFQTLLWGIVNNQEKSISELPLLTEAERYQLLVEWNNTQAEYPQTCLHQLFEAQVEQIPDAVAVVFGEEKLTYKELNTRVNQLAHYLQTLGVKPDVPVAICFERSLEMIVGLLGILKASGAYIPLDPTYPKERLTQMLSDSQTSLLLTTDNLAIALPEHPLNVVYLDTNWSIIAQQSLENPVTEATPKNLAYVIYTSGSTGQPKGVACTHQGVTNLLADFQIKQPLAQGNRCSLWTSISFDVSVYEIFSALLVGGELHLTSESMRYEAITLFEWLQSQQIHSAYIPPFMLKDLADWLQKKPRKLALKRLLVGVEPIAEQLLQSISQLVPGLQIINGYGPSEATICATLYTVSSPSTCHQNTPIGRPVQNTEIYLLDAYLQPVPLNVPGELYIGSVGLASGYLNNSLLTAQKFISNPFKDTISGCCDSRLYKTGDLGRYLSDGNIEFLGRIDNQVKLRGLRIELGEIEAVLSKHPQVRQVVVILREDTDFPRLVAYIVPHKQAQNLVGELRNFLTAHLPNYMVPSAFLILEALPLFPNGKVNKQGLPAPDTSRPELDKAFVAPRTSAEITLCEIWAEFLNVTQVGINDNFFELGGDSIIAIQIIAKANQAGLKLTTKQLFQHQTIAQLANVAVLKQTIQIEQGLITGAVSLTPIQHWFFEQNFLNPHHWNQTIALEMPQALDLDLLEQALQHLLLHHDALRLRFEKTEFGWQQILVGSDITAALARFDFSRLPKIEQEQAFQDSTAELQTSLNLSDGSIVRFAVYDFGTEQPRRLLLIIHHLAVDTFSWRVLLEDLQTAYQQLNQGKNLELPAKTNSFKYWSEHLHEYAQSVNLQKERDYWLTQCQQQTLPVDFPDGENIVASQRNIAIALSLEQTQALLQKVPQAYNTQINDVLLTALVQAFAQWTGTGSLLIALESHGREEIFADLDLSRTVGWFTSIFPVLLDLGKTTHPGEALKTIKEQLRAIPDGGIGYGILRYLNQDNGLQNYPEPEVVFNYLGQFDQTFSNSSLFRLVQNSSGLMSSPHNKRSSLLEINGLVVNNQLQFDWTFSENIHRYSTIENLAQEFVKALTGIITHCQSTQEKNYTPSDFPELDLSQKGLDNFLAKLNRKGKSKVI